MAINTIQGYNPSTTEPIDSRIIKANASTRLAIANFDAYKGLLVYQQDTGELYVCNNPSDPSLETSWAKVFTSTGTSGSYTGSFQGDGAGLTNVPASGIVGLNLSRTATGSVTASVNVGATPFTIESGSFDLVSVTSAGRIAVSKSINIGTPNLDPWGTGLDGSYFNNFNATDDVSDILRFMAGLLSASAPDAAPNTRTWESTNVDFQVGGTPVSQTNYMTGVLAGLRNARLSQEWNQSNSIITGNTGSYRNLQTYLISKGWMDSSETGSQALHDVGTHPFGTENYANNLPDNNIYTASFSSFTFNVDSSVGSTTTIFSSSIGPQAFGLGRLINATTPTPYSLSIIYTQSFSDNASDQTPGVSSTYSTGSSRLYTRSTVGNSNGLYLGIIETGNDLIPNAFQDAKFLNSPASFATRKWGDAGTDGDVTSSIGHYRFHGISVGITSSLQAGFDIQSPGSVTNAFYMPSLGTLGVQNITQNDPTVTISDSVDIATFTVVSRSLSGAPYILDVDYTVNYSTQVSKSFDPCYGYSQTPIAVTTPTDQWDTVGTTTLSNTSVSVTTSGVQTSTGSAGVFPAGGNPSTRRSTNDILAIGDVAFLSSSVVFNLDSSFSNTVVSKSIQETTNYDLIFRTTGRNWKNTPQTLNSTTQEFYDATRFGQPSTSGSMAIYSFSQTYDGGSLTGTAENFTGESYRIQLNDNVPTFTGDAWDTSEAYYNLGGQDLQVKPEFLVRPGGTFGYWLTDPDPSEDFKYYIRRFRRAGSVGSFTIDAGQALTPWGDTSGTNTISIAVIFESAKDSGGSNCRLYDITLSNGPKTPATFTSASVGTNPFTSYDLDHYGAGGGVSGTTYTITMVTGDGMVLNGNSGTDEFYVIVRYKGNPNPITSLAVS